MLTLYKKFLFPVFILTLTITCFGNTALASGVTPTPNHNLSLNFHDIPVRDLLELLAEFKGVNLILSDSVAGNITLRLENVSWDQALKTILRMQGLSKEEQDTILFIAPTQEMTTLEQQNIETQPLHNTLFRLSYAKASDLTVLLQDKNSHLLSEQGSVVADTRTNALWIRDNIAHLQQIKLFLHDMDVPARQIQIAARIVNVDEDSVEELGLKFGTVSTTTATKPPGELSMDMPLSIEDIGHFTVAIAKLSEGTLLDMELSALEREGRAQLISNPELITSDRQSASIESGQEIPYQEKTSSGATSISFKKAVLSLKVIPEISPENKILLNLTVNQDKISALSVNGVPAISTQQVQTQILVNNGETIVLGGIYEESNSHIHERIPFWGSIPVLGALFTNKQTHAERKELLIFVTPKIIESISIIHQDAKFKPQPIG